VSDFIHRSIRQLVGILSVKTYVHISTEVNAVILHSLANKLVSTNIKQASKQSINESIIDNQSINQSMCHE